MVYGVTPIKKKNTMGSEEKKYFWSQIGLHIISIALAISSAWADC